MSNENVENMVDSLASGDNVAAQTHLKVRWLIKLVKR